MIAFDSADGGGYTALATSLTFSHTCSGDNRILFVTAQLGNATEKITGITYNGVSMTQLHKQQRTAYGWEYLYYLLNPATGVHDVVISASANDEIIGVGASYKGVKQTGFPDSSAVSKDTTSSSPLSKSATSTADNCWMLYWLNQAGLTSTSTGKRRITFSNLFYLQDTNYAITPAGSTTLSWTFSGTITEGVSFVVTIAPADEEETLGRHFLDF